MSDTRQEAAQELAAAGIQTGMEDTLGATLSSSFAPPSTAKSHHPATETGTTQASGAVAAEPETESTPVPGMDEWKSVLDHYNVEWKKEADEARAKAEKNRKFYEDEAEAKAKALKDEEALKKRREREEKRAEEGRERLRRELAGEVKPRPGAKGKEEKDKVKEAWEMVKAEGDGEGKVKEVVTDARGVMPQDIRAGQAHAQGEPRHQVKQTMYDPTTSTEPLPPSMLPTPPRKGPTSHPSESQATSRHSATSQAWEEISASPSSAEDISPASTSTGSGFSSSPGQDIQPTPISKDAASYANLPTTSGASEKPQSQFLVPRSSGANSPPTQPPSLTLSLFTSPANLSVTRVIAVLGINLVLPFINGVMLGFGEIFARETVRVGRLVWRGERQLFGWGGRGAWGAAEAGEARGGGRGVAGVGLSGSGGFP